MESQRVARVLMMLRQDLVTSNNKSLEIRSSVMLTAFQVRYSLMTTVLNLGVELWALGGPNAGQVDESGTRYNNSR